MRVERRRPRVRLGVALTTALSTLVGVLPLRAGDGVINANQHRTTDNSPCTYPPGGGYTCPENETVPFTHLANNAWISAHSYHVLADCQSLQARCEYQNHSRPKILSSDGCVDPLEVQDWIVDIENTASPYHPLGSIHFEHFDACLSRWATEGNAIAGFSTLPGDAFCEAQESSQEMLQWIQSNNGASVLQQNGLLLRSNDRLQWKVGASATNRRLIGYGFMGAISAGDRLNITEYLKMLREYNVNFTRVWAVEQWTALTVNDPSGPPSPEGPTPFVGTLLDGDYLLFQPNPSFYSRLRQFAQGSADRGIVVQLSLFDKHGLRCLGTNGAGQYQDSPFRDVNNDQPFLENAIPGCTCSASTCQFDFTYSLLEGGTCEPLASFVKTLGNPNFAQIRAMQVGLLRRTGEEIGAIGNMIYEVINEHRFDHDWEGDEDGDTILDGEEWQIEMARQMRLSLPLANGASLNVARDAFNGDVSGTALQSKASDLAGMPWTSVNNNAKVVVEFEEEGGAGASRLLGYATSRALAGFNFMSAHVPFGSSSSWTKMHVRADIAVSSGTVSIGAGASNGHAIFVTVENSPSEIRLYKTGNCMIQAATCLLGTASYSTPAAWHNVRLKIEVDPVTDEGIASVFVDGAAVTGLQNVDFGDIPTFDRAYFNGLNGATPYPANVGKVDNFEAARFCTETTEGCTP